MTSFPDQGGDDQAIIAEKLEQEMEEQRHEAILVEISGTVTVEYDNMSIQGEHQWPVEGEVETWEERRLRLGLGNCIVSRGSHLLGRWLTIIWEH